MKIIRAFARLGWIVSDVIDGQKKYGVAIGVLAQDTMLRTYSSI